ncbi:MAG: hypothetical protein ACK5UE_02440 [Chitinophagales bacterium]|jgi:hypothetical protein
MTKHIETKFEHLLTNSHKADMIAYMESHPEDFTEAIKLAIADKQPYSWRASWLLWSCMDKNDKRVRRYLKKIIDILPERKDNQQRELLMILQRMELNDEYEGQLFDSCTKIWEQVSKKIFESSIINKNIIIEKPNLLNGNYKVVIEFIDGHTIQSTIT